MIRGVANSNIRLSSDPVPQPARPLPDEWGLFDPEQAGIEALLRRLSASDKTVASPRPGTSGK